MNVEAATTLVQHSVRYPNPQMPNRPEFFGLPENSENKKIRSLGRMKLFPEEVQAEVFGDDAKDSPLQKLALIRSRLQGFINTFTIPFANGLANAMPDSKLPAFSALVGQWQKEFNEARSQYLNSYDDLQEESITFWRKHAELYKVTPQQMEDAIRGFFDPIEKFEDKFLFQVLHFNVTTPADIAKEGIPTAEQEAIYEARQKVAQESAAKLREARDQFIVDAVTEMRERATKTFNELKLSVEEDKWNQKSINSVLKFIDQFKDMNFFDDKELEAFLEQQRTMFSQTAKDIKADKSGNMTAGLQKNIDEAIGKLKEMAAADKQEVIKKFQKLGSSRNLEVDIDDEF